MKLLKLTGLTNLLLLALSLFIFKYGFLDRQAGFTPALNHWQYALFVLACVFIAAGGFFMNNVFGCGKEANTEVSESKGYNIYIALTIIGVGLGYYIANFTGKPMYVSVFVVAAATMYIYATSLKQTVLISNIVVALLMTLPIVAVGLFNIYPMLSPYNQPLLATLFGLLLDYTYFTFAISLIYTLVNDLARTDADYNAGIDTLPILLGRARTLKIVLVFSLLPLGLLFFYGNEYFKDLLYAAGYTLLFIVAPLIYFLLRIWNAATEKDFDHLEKVLKLILFFTALSIAVITFNIQYNVKG